MQSLVGHGEGFGLYPKSNWEGIEGTKSPGMICIGWYFKELSGNRVHKGLGLEWGWVGSESPWGHYGKCPDQKTGTGERAVEETEGREVEAFMIHS